MMMIRDWDQRSEEFHSFNVINRLFIRQLVNTVLICGSSFTPTWLGILRILYCLWTHNGCGGGGHCLSVYPTCVFHSREYNYLKGIWSISGWTFIKSMRISGSKITLSLWAFEHGGVSYIWSTLISMDQYTYILVLPFLVSVSINQTQFFASSGLLCRN